jgi:hypothetical protein
MKYALLTLLLAGCGHIVLDLKAHEEEHCREFGVPESGWVYHYTPNVNAICREKTGLIFVDGCAESIGNVCSIYLPDGTYPDILQVRDLGE